MRIKITSNPCVEGGESSVFKLARLIQEHYNQQKDFTVDIKEDKIIVFMQVDDEERDLEAEAREKNGVSGGDGFGPSIPDEEIPF